MKKKSGWITLLLQIAIFGAFAANPASDFLYELKFDNNNNEYVRIYGTSRDFQGNSIETPSQIKGVPVKDISIWAKCNIKITGKVKKIEITSATIITDLPNTVEELHIEGGFSKNQSGKTQLDVNLNNLTNLKKLELWDTNLKYKNVLVRGSDWIIYNTNVEELIFKDNLETINSNYTMITGEYRDYQENNNLKKIILPASIKTIRIKAFYKCPSLFEIVIPENITHIKIGIPYSKTGINGTTSVLEFLEQLPLPVKYEDGKPKDVFDMTSIPMKNQARLIGVFQSRQEQRKFEFAHDLD